MVRLQLTRAATPLTGRGQRASPTGVEARGPTKKEAPRWPSRTAKVHSGVSSQEDSTRSMSCQCAAPAPKKAAAAGGGGAGGAASDSPTQSALRDCGSLSLRHWQVSAATVPVVSDSDSEPQRNPRTRRTGHAHFSSCFRERARSWRCPLWSPVFTVSCYSSRACVLPLAISSAGAACSH